MKKAVIYVRVSSEEQVGNNSLDEQEKKCKYYIKSQGFEYVKTYREEGVSGAKKNRLALDELIEDAKEKKFGAIVFLKIDRLSRDLRHFLDFVEIFDECGVEMQSVQESFDTSTHTGRLMINILASFAEYERDLIRERSMMGRIASMKKGVWHGSAPFGYDKNEEKKLVINKEEAKIVKKMFNLIADKDPLERVTLHKIQKKVNSWKVKTKKAPGAKKKSGDTFWAARTIGRVLTNPVYVGEKVLRRYTTKTVANSVRTERPEGERIKISVPKIIDKDVFDLVQQELIKNKVNATRNRKSDAMLARIMYCSLCNRKYTPANKGEELTYYYCMGRNKAHTDKKCPSYGIRSNNVEGPIWDLIKNILTNPNILNSKLKEMREKQFGENKIQEKIDMLEAETKKKNEQKEKLLVLYLEGHLEKVRYISELATMEKEIEELINKISVERTRLASGKEIMKRFGSVKSYVDKLEKKLENISYEKKADIAHLLIQRVDIVGQTAKVLLGIPDESAKLVRQQDTARIYRIAKYNGNSNKCWRFFVGR